MNATRPWYKQHMAEQTESITGAVESVIFRNEPTGFTVCALRIPGREEPVTTVGHCATLWIGETLRADGVWARHPRHGYQFQAETMTCVVPTSTEGIKRFLSSGMIRGIGKELAERLVVAFGQDTIEIIDHQSQRLEEVEGIGPIRRQRIRESWAEQRAVRDIMIFLQSHGIGTAQATRIYRQYGSDAVALISENPYRLSREIWGIGFKTADNVARSVGIPAQSPARARAGLLHIVQTRADDGHCYWPEPQLLLESQDLLDIPAEIIAEALRAEIAEGDLVLDRQRIYLRGLDQAEREVAARLTAIAGTPPPFPPIDAGRALDWAENRMKLAFAPRQRDALTMALANKVSVITGGPGVGKTTIIRALVDVFQRRGLRVFLAAPTGRAAKRMEEATHAPAATLHRLLKFNPAQRGFEYNGDHPLACDVLIVDECSMIDIALMRHVLAAVPDPACMVLVGDTDQLPSVGPGNVLRDIIDAETVPCCRLETIFRQESGGWIVRNAHHVNRGEPLEIPPDGGEADFFFVPADQPEDVIHKTILLITERIPRRFGFDPLNDIQVLTPMRRNQLGADNLNGVLQDALNPGGNALNRFGRAYRHGDRVMQIRNNYDKAVFNGDIGRIASVDREDQKIVVAYDERRVAYDIVELDELVHAYACSIHKSQGSEYPAVIVLMTTQHYKLLQRNLLYTALTRGRKLVCLVGQKKAVAMAIRNNEIRLRRTSLRERLAPHTRILEPIAS